MKMSRSTRWAARLFSALRLEGLGKAAYDRNRLRVSLDGEEQDLTLPGPHFLPSAPGTRKLKVALVGFTPGAKTLDPVYYGTATDVLVTAEMVTPVVYTPTFIKKLLQNATIAVQEPRPG